MSTLLFEKGKPRQIDNPMSENSFNKMREIKRPMPPLVQIIRDLEELTVSYQEAELKLQGLRSEGKIDDKAFHQFSRKLLFEYEREKIIRSKLMTSSEEDEKNISDHVMEMKKLSNEREEEEDDEDYAGQSRSESDELALLDERQRHPSSSLQIESGIKANAATATVATSTAKTSKSKKKKKESYTIMDSLKELIYGAVLNSGLNAMLKHLNVRKYREAKNLFKSRLGYLGLVFNFCFMAIFCTLFSINYINLHVKQKFVAVDPTSGDCAPVARPYTLPEISGDFYGNWLGQYSFQANMNCKSKDFKQALICVCVFACVCLRVCVFIYIYIFACVYGFYFGEQCV